MYCKHCDLTKPSSEFYEGRAKCKACYSAGRYGSKAPASTVKRIKEYTAKYDADHAEEAKARAEKHRQNRSEAQKAATRKRENLRYASLSDEKRAEYIAKVIQRDKEKNK